MINSLTQHWGSEGSRREQPEKNQFSSLAFLLWLESGFSSDSLSHPSTADHHFPCLTSSSSYLLIGLQKKSKLKMQNKWQRAGFVNIRRLLSESKKSFISFDINLMFSIYLQLGYHVLSMLASCEGPYECSPRNEYLSSSFIGPAQSSCSQTLLLSPFRLPWKS